MKQPAVEWLAEKWLGRGFKDVPDGIVEQAKEMEKQQMLEFARAFWYYAYGADAPPVYNEDVEKFYNKTHGK